MAKAIHPVAGTLALVIILSFWLSTAISELSGNLSLIVTVKTLIPWGFLALIPLLIMTGATGARLARSRQGRLIARKQRRMPVIAANGVLILVPSALFLSMKAGAGAFDTGFYLIQLVELVAGAVNICLLGLSLRDGLRMTGRLRRRPVRRVRDAE